MVEVNTSDCAVPGDQLELSGRHGKDKQVKNRGKKEEKLRDKSEKTMVLLAYNAILINTFGLPRQPL